MARYRPTDAVCLYNQHANDKEVMTLLNDYAALTGKPVMTALRELLQTTLPQSIRQLRAGGKRISAEIGGNSSVINKQDTPASAT